MQTQKKKKEEKREGELAAFFFFLPKKSKLCSMISFLSLPVFSLTSASRELLSSKKKKKRERSSLCEGGLNICF